MKRKYYISYTNKVIWGTGYKKTTSIKNAINYIRDPFWLHKKEKEDKEISKLKTIKCTYDLLKAINYYGGADDGSFSWKIKDNIAILIKEKYNE